LVIPKDRNGLTQIRKASAEHTDILGRLLVAAGEIANDSDLGFGDGAKIVINDGNDGGQEVYHIHVHVLGGRKLGKSLLSALSSCFVGCGCGLVQYFVSKIMCP
jgi:diadenosine tetraphosphate (Ap4A) HIT family hydrolase